MAVTILYNPECSKCQYALGKLQQCDLEVNIIEYLVNTPTKEELEDLVKKLGIKAEDLVRKNEDLFIKNYSDVQLTDAEWIGIMVKHPQLIQRPVIVRGDRAVIGRDDDSITRIIGGG